MGGFRQDQSSIRSKQRKSEKGAHRGREAVAEAGSGMAEL